MNNLQLPDSPIWFVRAERGNVIAKHFLDRGIVEMGWGIGPIKDGVSDNQIITLLDRRWPNNKLGTLRAWSAQIKRFNRKMEVGDAVATVSTYQPQGRLCHIGVIKSLLAPVEPGPHYDEYVNDYIHRVKWLYQVPHNVLSEYTQRRLSLPPTLHRLNRQASAELRLYCS